MLSFLLVVATVMAGCETTPPPEPAPPPPALTARAAILTVNFDLNSARLSPAARTSLDTVATAMQSPELAQADFVIEGHTDVTGRLGRNMALSEMRANAVLDYLASKGVDRVKMRAEGYGPLRLLLPQDPRNASNRRVEVAANPAP